MPNEQVTKMLTADGIFEFRMDMPELAKHVLETVDHETDIMTVLFRMARTVGRLHELGYRSEDFAESAAVSLLVSKIRSLQTQDLSQARRVVKDTSLQGIGCR
jgi:hypothetical protein